MFYILIRIISNKKKRKKISLIDIKDEFKTLMRKKKKLEQI